MVGKPDDPKDNNKDETHLDNLPLLLNSPGNGWLPGRVLLHPEDLIPSPELLPHHRIAISWNIITGSELVIIHIMLTHHQEGEQVGDHKEGQAVPGNNSLYFSIRFYFLKRSFRLTELCKRHKTFFTEILVYISSPTFGPRKILLDFHLAIGDNRLYCQTCNILTKSAIF